MPCHSCGRNFHAECLIGCSKCHPEPEEEIEFLKEDSALNGSTPTPKERKTLIDPASTGRKRAAKLYPLDPEKDCDWRGKKNCGGGRRPIVGCPDGKQKHRHHGPVKNTTYNHLGNVHRICHNCHVRWHELNDLIYDESDYNILPHDPIPATMEEIVENELKWSSGRMKSEFELKSSRKTKVLEDVTGEAD